MRQGDCFSLLKTARKKGGGGRVAHEDIKNHVVSVLGPVGAVATSAAVSSRYLLQIFTCDSNFKLVINGVGWLHELASLVKISISSWITPTCKP